MRDIGKFLEEKFSQLFNPDQTINSKVYLEMVTEIGFIFKEISTDKSRKQQIEKILNAFNALTIEYKKVESLQKEEDEKIKVVKQILDVGASKLNQFINQLNLTLNAIKEVLGIHGRDKEYFELYKKVLTLSNDVSQYHDHYLACFNLAKKYCAIKDSFKRVSKLTNLFSEVQNVFKEIADISSRLTSVHSEVIAYKETKGDAPQEYVDPEAESLQKDKQEEDRLNKIIAIKDELERRKAKMIEDRGYLVEFKEIK